MNVSVLKLVAIASAAVVLSGLHRAEAKFGVHKGPNKFCVRERGSCDTDDGYDDDLCCGDWWCWYGQCKPPGWCQEDGGSCESALDCCEGSFCNLDYVCEAHECQPDGGNCEVGQESHDELCCDKTSWCKDGTCTACVPKEGPCTFNVDCCENYKCEDGQCVWWLDWKPGSFAAKTK